MITKEEVLKNIENLSFEEQVDFVNKKFAEAKSQYNLHDSILYGELLDNKYNAVGIKFELPGLYNRAGDYEKTIAFVSNWMLDSNSLNLISMDVRPLIDLCDAYIQTQNFEQAITNLQLATAVIENSLELYADKTTNEAIVTLNLKLAYVKAQLASVYYYQSMYSEAVDFLKESFSYGMTVIACYFAASIYEKSEEFKSYELAIEYFEKIANIQPTPKNTEFYSLDDWYQVNANYELGMIYTTADQFIDKEKAYKYFKKANTMGYNISEDEIKDIVEKIETENSYENSLPNAENNKNEKKSSDGCYVATCVYGSYDCPEVWTLRRFRDYTLKENLFGRIFIKLYYSISPTAVKLFGKYKWFHNLFKMPLDKFVAKLQEKGVKNTPYCDNKQKGEC